MSVGAGARRANYTGILAEPIPRILFAQPTIVEGDVCDWRRQRALALMIEKTDALCAHYGCNPKLVTSKHHVMELGMRYVPGFQVETKKSGGGAPKRWDDVRLAWLWTSYCLIRSENQHLSQTSALANMAKDNAFGLNFSRLKEMLPKAKKSPLVQMLMSDHAEDRKFAENFLGDHLA
jgi:hypothetical protein